MLPLSLLHRVITDRPFHETTFGCIVYQHRALNGSIESLGAEDPVALPAANEALILADLSSKEAGQNTRLLEPGVQSQMPAVGELEDAHALLGGEVTLCAVSARGDDEGIAAAVCFRPSSISLKVTYTV